jgi:hypothetical protein
MDPMNSRSIETIAHRGQVGCLVLALGIAIFAAAVLAS